MPRLFQEDGISFRYPEDWRLEREEADGGWTVLLQSPGTAFLTLTTDSNLPSQEDMAETALEALRADYPGLESEARVDTLAGQMAVGHDIRFFSLDLTNTCWTRSFYSAAGTVLVLCQSSDLDLEEHEPALRAICASLRVEEE
jgi:hypothetical protein